MIVNKAVRKIAEDVKWLSPAWGCCTTPGTGLIGRFDRHFSSRWGRYSCLPLIARDTVEEKVVELQKTKRDLAQAIISADSAVLRNLTAEDLRMLLS